MKHLLTAWQANHDIQFILDGYAVATYIIAYTCKAQKGMSALLDTAAKEAKANNMDLKESVRHMGNKFLNGVETGAQEAAYLVLQTPITRSSKDVQFLNTNKPEDRPFILKDKKRLEKLDPTSNAVQTEGLISYYAKRPRCLHKYCLADYTSYFSIKYPKLLENEYFADNLEDDPADDSLEPEEEFERSLNTNDNDADLEIGTKYILRNGITITRRKNPKVIRFVNFSKNHDSEQYYRERLLLFHPWVNTEDNLIGGFETYELHFEHLRRTTNIELKRKEYERIDDEILEEIQHAEDEGVLDMEQDELEDTVQTKECLFYDPERDKAHELYDIGHDLHMQTSLTETDTEYVGPKLPEFDYKKLLLSLNKKQREIFTHITETVKTKTENLYLFLTGGAGVGKSQVVKALYQFLLRHLCSAEGQNPNDIRIQILAPSGFAAYIVGGTTIHTALKFPANQGLQYKPLPSEKLNTLRAKYLHLKFLIIDEISMVGCRMFNFINQRLQDILGRREPFGGISVLAIGDMYQLAPVFDQYIFQPLPDGYGPLATNLWTEHFRMFQLDQVMRQQDDMEFANILNRLRTGKQTETDLTYLSKRHISLDDTNYPKGIPHLFALKALVRTHNSNLYETVETLKTVVHAQDHILTNSSKKMQETILNSLRTVSAYDEKAGLARSLNIAVSLVYSISLNLSIEDGLVNGASCVVKHIQYISNLENPAIIWVQFHDEVVGREQRHKHRSKFTDEIEKSWTPIFAVGRTFQWGTRSNNFIMRTQFPLKQSNARTIHSSQGGTFNEIVVNMTKCPARFSHIHYVALSRVRSISDLYIIDLAADKITQCPAVEKYMYKMEAEMPLKLCYTPVYQDKEFHIMFNNAQSFKKSFKKLKTHEMLLNASIIGIANTESPLIKWSEEYTLQHFDIHRTPLNTNASDEEPMQLFLCIRHNVEEVHTCSYSNEHFIAFTARVRPENHHEVFSVIFVYASPKCTFEILTESLKDCIAMCHQDDKCIIMGDFNMNSITNRPEEYNAPLQQYLQSVHNFKQHIQVKTTNYNINPADVKKRKLDVTIDLLFANSSASQNLAYAHAIDTSWSNHKMLHGTMTFQPHVLKVLFHNARSVHANFIHLKNDPNITSASVVAFAESRLIHSDPSTSFSLPDYQVIRFDQVQGNPSQRPPHGLIMFIRNSVKILEKTFYRSNYFEAIKVVLHPPKAYETFHLLIIYVSPKCPFSNLKREIQKCLSNQVYHEPFIVMGDFNMKSIVHDENYNSKLETFMWNEYHFKQLVVKETSDYHSKLDLIFSNRTMDNVDVIDNYWSDHKLIYTTLPLTPSVHLPNP